LTVLKRISACSSSWAAVAGAAVALIGEGFACGTGRSSACRS
jgi:hypothetical protein